MSVDFLTPSGGLLALAVLLPLAIFFGISRRARRVRRSLGLPALPAGRRLVPLFAVLAVAALLGLAAAQPLVERTSTRDVRADAEVLIVMDISRSMLAQRSVDAPTRLERAKAAALKLRAALPGVRVGLASMTNRLLPHLFPSADQDVFQATLDRVIGIERPPPGTSFLTALQTRLRNATSLASLASISGERFFSPAAKHRLVVVLTDGESPQVAAATVGRSMQQAKAKTIFVQFWKPNENVFTNGEAEVRYHQDPAARSILERLAVATGGTVYDETQLGAVVRSTRDDLGSGPMAKQGRSPDRLPLAPYLAVAAFLPLTLLLWRRDR